jgi:16S rRNA G966 N2-methylase RsmD
MARWGLPYQGSKNGIADWVVDNLPPSDCLVDLFAGGCAVTHCAMVRGKWKRYVANDITPYPQIFKDAIDGKFRDAEDVIVDREAFFASDDPVVRLLNSFGNKGKEYLWSHELEAVKYPASRMLIAHDEKTRRLYYRQFMHALYEYIEANGKSVGVDARHAGDLESLESLERLERLQSLERLERLQSLQSLKGQKHNMQHLTIYNMDYRDVELPQNATIYCDPPYRETTQYHGNTFDFDAFDKWLEDVGRLVIVSEYTAPKNCVCVAKREKSALMKPGSNENKVTEGLFVHEKHLAEYEAAVQVGKTQAMF